MTPFVRIHGHRGDRSHLIDEAIRFYIREVGRSNLRKQLREGAIDRAARDLRLSQDWFHIENEAWQERKK